MLSAVAACLPRGDPPAGRQIVADRRSALTGIVPPTGDGVSPILVTRPSRPGSEDLFVISVEPAGGAPQETLLAANIDAGFGLGCRDNVAPCGAIDAARGVWVYPSRDNDGDYQFPARTDSPYDGIWMAEAP